MGMSSTEKRVCRIKVGGRMPEGERRLPGIAPRGVQE
jgi:hypothetical protein